MENYDRRLLRMTFFSAAEKRSKIKQLKSHATENSKRSKFFPLVNNLKAACCPTVVNLPDEISISQPSRSKQNLVSSRFIGCEDAGGRGCHVCNVMAPLSIVRRLQFIRKATFRRPLVLVVLSSGNLRQQRRESDTLQRNVGQVPFGVPRPVVMLLRQLLDVWLVRAFDIWLHIKIKFRNPG
jgi:hypothetical protein